MVRVASANESDVLRRRLLRLEPPMELLQHVMKLTVQDICTKSHTGIRFEASMDKNMDIPVYDPVPSFFFYCDCLMSSYQQKTGFPNIQ